jgi:tetratricopeptide (TPR) repeat protein
MLGTASAADTYDASLKAGDAHRARKDYAAALAEYDTAHQLGTNEGMKALALGKKAGVLVEQKNYSAAREAADQALSTPDLAPVARVIALQALAECQMKAEPTDYVAATATLQQALALEGVDWARPALTMLLGDCHRFQSKFTEALEAYQSILEMPAANDGIKSIAYLNQGITFQYGLNDNARAETAYAEAVKLNAGLETEVAGHKSRFK